MFPYDFIHFNSGKTPLSLKDVFLRHKIQSSSERSFGKSNTSALREYYEYL